MHFKIHEQRVLRHALLPPISHHLRRNTWGKERMRERVCVCGSERAREKERDRERETKKQI